MNGKSYIGKTIHDDFNVRMYCHKNSVEKS